MVTAVETLTLGWKCQQAGDVASAERLYRQALQAEPGNAQAYYLLGRLLRAAGQPCEAAVQLRQALLLDPRLRNASNQLALALSSLGHFDDAAEVLRQAIARIGLQSLRELHASRHNLLPVKGRKSQFITAPSQGFALPVSSQPGHARSSAEL